MESTWPLQQNFNFDLQTHDNQCVAADHLLGLLYHTYVSTDTTETNTTGTNTVVCLDLENTASKLAEAGVKFKTTQETNLMNICFRDGVLVLPKLNAYDSSIEIILGNLIAYEQMIYMDNITYRHMTDYIMLMTSLVKSEKDVEVLRRNGVIENWLKDDDAIHVLMSKLAKNMIVKVDCFFYSNIFHSLNEHCRKRRHKWITSLRRKYCNTPWRITSVVAAAVLLLLTLGQTIIAAIIARR